jgi:acyl carrier protein
MNNLLSQDDINAVLEIVADIAGTDQSQLTNETRLKEDLHTDSLMDIEINMALEDHFNLSIPDERLEGIATVADILELVAEMKT